MGLLSAQAAAGTLWLLDSQLRRGKPMAHKFEIYKDKAGEFRVRFKYNSEVMFSTEGYSSKASAQNAIDSIKKNGPDAPVEDNTAPKA
jgi:uncharacterized protein YegP (UPF0339 family)